MAIFKPSAVSFDLFNTLVYVPRDFERTEGYRKMHTCLFEHDYRIPLSNMTHKYRQTWERMMAEAVVTLKEFTNVEVLSEVVREEGYDPDPKIMQESVNGYFQHLTDNIKIFKDTIEVLKRVSEKFKIVLISNHTWAPNGWDVLRKFQLDSLFERITFSGECGLRKPAEGIFRQGFFGVTENLSKTVHIGDDPEQDIDGALSIGMKAIWIKRKSLYHDGKVPKSSEGLLASVKKIGDQLLLKTLNV